jgi:23S rRNA pseudouridine2605 synthase/23S rRNA pseudouridine2604 synthase
MILTDDGPLHHLLSHPSFDHEKCYQVTTDRPISNHALDQLAQGVLLDGRPTRPARVKRLGARRFQIVLKEGRNRQIRRMVGVIGLRVTTLHRTRVAHISLGGLAPGKWRHLGAHERAKLLALRSASGL